MRPPPPDLSRPDALFVPVTDIIRRVCWDDVLPGHGPVHLDLGAGDGGFAVAFAAQNPALRVIAVERLLGRARKIDRRARRRSLPNIRVFRIESAYFLRYMVPPRSVACIHLMHPDPWPKKRQQKHRIFNAAFLDSCARALIPGGELRAVTDHADYFAAMLESAAADPRFLPSPWQPPPDYPRSDFELDYLNLGQPIHRQTWVRGDA